MNELVSIFHISVRVFRRPLFQHFSLRLANDVLVRSQSNASRWLERTRPVLAPRFSRAAKSLCKLTHFVERNRSREHFSGRYSCFEKEDEICRPYCRLQLAKMIPAVRIWLYNQPPVIGTLHCWVPSAKATAAANSRVAIRKPTTGILSSTHPSWIRAHFTNESLDTGQLCGGIPPHSSST